MAEGEVAAFIKRIDAEYEAAQHGLTGLVLCQAKIDK